MGNVGIPELIFIFILALLVFGPKKLPELGRNLGKALAQFRRASADLRVAVEDEMRELERHTQELERQTTEALNPPGDPVALPDGQIGSGTIAPPEAPPVVPEPPQTGEKPADGEPKPA